MIKEVTIIIRTAQERTKEYCKQLITQQVPENQVFILQEKPFSKAVERTFQIGLEQNRKWTLAIDADILLREKAIIELLQRANKFEKKIVQKLFVYQGSVLCKIFGRTRKAGFHLYVTKNLERGLSFLQATKLKTRPESAIYKEMLKLGYYKCHDSKVYGLHAYEQSYADMFKNGYFQAKKHFELGSVLTSYWAKKADVDLDFKVLLYGWFISLIDKQELIVSDDFFKTIIKREFSKLQIEEKSSLEKLDNNQLHQFVKEEIHRYNNTNHNIEKIELKNSLSIIGRIKNKIGRSLVNFGNDLQQ